MDSHILSNPGWFRVAIQALVVLPETDGVCTSTVIAQELKAHATFLRRVMVQLVQAGIVVAREGRDGGYRLARPAESITLAEVYRAARIACQLESGAAREIGNARVQQVLGEVANELEHSLLTILDRYTIASMIENPLPFRPHA